MLRRPPEIPHSYNAKNFLRRPTLLAAGTLRDRMPRTASFAVVGLLLTPAVASAAAGKVEVAPWSVAPFALLLLAIAILPLVAGHFWHSNARKFLVAMLLALPVVGYLLLLDYQAGGEAHGRHALEHVLLEYMDFIVLLFALYTVSGGILLQGSLPATPFLNLFFLTFGAVLSNLIGTTGASMLLIRPVLRINASRIHNAHIPVFFIFAVSNLGGLLTPLGDPPLFLGFLRGVDFFWTMQLWPQWSVAVGAVLVVFFLWDTIAFAREPGHAQTKVVDPSPLRVRGLFNWVFLAGILAAVLLQSETVAMELRAWLNQFFV